MDAEVLIHTDNVELFLLLKHILETEGFPARICVDPKELLDAIQTEKAVAILLDCSSRGEEAPGLCRQIRTAGGDEVTVAALANSLEAELSRDLHAAGVDTVLFRPLKPIVLLSLLKRLHTKLPHDPRPRAAPELIFRHADIEMNVTRVRVTRNGHAVRLSALQFRLLLHLMRTPDIVHSREDLIAAGWPREAEVEPRTVDIHIGHIRRALNRYGPNIIRTVRSVGYSLDEVAQPIQK
ncbi:winged helix-turn-helix transcriptional regulator [Sinorhizobium fredii]|uniref:winged helix-turn-helix transcriptional regulator n=1 Tax=Rhizobium fredii TaxID=380 RepID=UPI00210CC410|nr:response regulator transcription factor [Sinorhizobium fredii]UTY46617.1 response regulator transcription factor [Sinorhizobium fredii]